jgi:SAM-dependent methyltransferase
MAISRLLRSVRLKKAKKKKNNKSNGRSKEERIQEAADYAERIFSLYERLFRERGIALQGRQYLEIGPGGDFGSQLLMTRLGASVTVADRFLAQWDPEFHPALYRTLLARVGRSPAIERVIEQSGYDGVINLVSAPAEDLKVVPDGTFDIVMSNAVLEHVYDLGATARELRRVSKPGAVHVHQVDFRDHRDFARPLECLLRSRRQFLRRAVRINFESGCQTRPPELVGIFQDAGYTLDDTVPSHYADEKYLDEFMPRLRRAWFSPYRKWIRDDLRVVSACYWMTA